MTAVSFHNIQHFHEKVAVYTCCLYKKDISDVSTFFGQHLPDRSNEDVRGIALANCKISGFPRELSTIFPNLDHVAVNGGLRGISMDDLAGFDKLKFLDLQGCEIAQLPSDLFENSPNLEVVYFSHNKIATIGGALLDPLRSLKYIDMRGNVNINAVYDVDKTCELSLDEMKQLISACRPQNILADLEGKAVRVSRAQ